MKQNVESKLAFIVTREGFNMHLRDVEKRLEELGFITHTISDTNGQLRTADFYLNHLKSEGEDPATVGILITDNGVPFLQLASRMPNLSVVITRDPNYSNIIAVGGPRLIRAHYVPPPNCNPDSHAYATQMILSKLSNGVTAKSPVYH